MAPPLRFDGRVAVVTGAGRGIGRAYAHLLAELGARVVVNDLGSSKEGAGEDRDPADTVAREIVDRGGVAVADTSDIADPEGAQALIDRTVEDFGRIDALVNNAGIVQWAPFPDVDTDVFFRHLAVHVGGSFLTTRAAWPHMASQQYGRIVMTTSAGMLGLPDNQPYAAAKGGVIGLARSLSVAGAAHGITVNLIAPAAWTRMAGHPSENIDDDDPRAAMPQMSPDLVAPMVAYLAHESCPVTGEIYTAGMGRFARLFIASTEGYVHSTLTPTIDDVAEQWRAINDESGYSVPADLNAWAASFAVHLSRRSRS